MTSSAANRSDKSLDQKVTIQQKYRAAKRQISEQRRLIDRQERYIVKLVNRLADKNKQASYQQDKALENQKAKTTELRKELRRTKKLLEEKEEAIERLMKLVGSSPLANPLKIKRAVPFQKVVLPLKKQPETPQAPKRESPRYLSAYMSAMLDCGIDRLRLRRELTAILEDGGIETIYDLVTTPKPQLKSIEGLNSCRLQAIASKIKPMGLELEMNVKYIPELRKYIRKTI